MHKVLGMDHKPMKPRSKSAGPSNRESTGIWQPVTFWPSLKALVKHSDLMLASACFVQPKYRPLDTPACHPRDLTRRWRRKPRGRNSTANRGSFSSSRSVFRGNHVSKEHRRPWCRLWALFFSCEMSCGAISQSIYIHNSMTQLEPDIVQELEYTTVYCQFNYRV